MGRRGHTPAPRPLKPAQRQNGLSLSGPIRPIRMGRCGAPCWTSGPRRETCDMRSETPATETISITCQECGRLADAKAGQTYCSPACRSRAAVRRSRARRLPLRYRLVSARLLCVECQQPFSTGDLRAATCSGECATAWANSQGRRRLAQSRARRAGELETVEAVWRRTGATRTDAASSRVHRVVPDRPDQALCGYIAPLEAHLRLAASKAGPQPWEPRCGRCSKSNRTQAPAAA